MTDPQPEVDPMAVLLDAVHDALMRADYRRLGEWTTGIEAELARLEQTRDASALLRVRDRAVRNETCLLAAQRGFRAARRRMEEIRAARSGLITYDGKGRRSAPHPAGALAKRL